MHIRMERWAARVKRLHIDPEECMPHWFAALWAIGCFGFVGSVLYDIAQAGPPRPTGLVFPGIFLVMRVLALVPSTRYLALAATRVLMIMILLVVAIYFAWSLLTNDFRQLRAGELRRTPLPGTWVNKGYKKCRGCSLATSAQRG
jgi:hypothetical protein